MTRFEHAFRVTAGMWAALAAVGCARDRFVSLGGRETHAPVVIDAGRTVQGSAGAGARVPAAGMGAAPSSAPEPAALMPVRIDHSDANNPAGLGVSDVKKLKAGGPRGTLRWLYPYDQTVFPREMLPPTLMWEGSAKATAIYVHLHAKYFDYKTIIKPALARGALPLPAAPEQPQLVLDPGIWERAGEQTQGSSDPFTLELSTLDDGVVAGPVVLHFSIAQGAIKGSIYYSCTSVNAVASGAGWGSLLRIPPRRAAQVLVPGIAEGATGSCTGCHAVSANGARMITQTLNLGAMPGTDAFAKAYSYQLTPERGVQTKRGINRYAAFSALYPDGAKYLTGSLVQDGVFAAGPLGTSYGNIGSLDASLPLAATLYDSDTGEVVPDTGIPSGALMPMFSPDGRHLVFNDFAIDRAHGLAVMDYDTAQHKATNYQVLMREAPPVVPSVLDRGVRPGWPFFLPDSQGVVFVRTNSADFTGGAAAANRSLGMAATPSATPTLGPVQDLAEPPSSDLHIADVRSGTVTLLAKAMGFADQPAAERGDTYLPFGEADLHHNYNTTVSPVAAGGYFWVFFDSLRHFGNLGLQHQLWGAAIDIRKDGSYVVDPSHPPFYVAGQKFGANNYRAFAARDACLAEGPCTTGIDCCSGFCSDVCVEPPRDRCARTDEHCSTSADCCETASDACINGFCAFVPLE